MDENQFPLTGFSTKETTQKKFKLLPLNKEVDLSSKKCILDFTLKNNINP